MSHTSYLSIKMPAGWQTVTPVVVASFGFGISFGVVAIAAGFSASAALVMSATTFGGAAQIGTASVLGAGGGGAGAAATGALLNLRYLPMGLTAARAYRGPWWRRALQAQLLGDEAWAVSRRADGSHNPRLLFTAGAAVYVVWLAGTALGAIVLSSLSNLSDWGLDMISPALFFTLLWRQLATRRAQVAAGSAVVVALALVPVAPPGVPIIAASLACLIGLVA
jgi:predicted branched-subunit amino acid permease